MALFLADAGINALCLCMMLRLTGGSIRLKNVASGAVFGALMACALRGARVERTLQMAFWLPTALGMARLAAGRWSFRAAFVLFACAGLLGGTVYAVSSTVDSLWAGWLLGALAACLAAAHTLRAKRAACDVTRAIVTVTIHGCSTSFDGIIDSGNCLRDYLTHRPVVVLPEAAKARFGLMGTAIRPIFADTAGGRLMMDCITAEQMQIRSGGQVRDVRASAAFSPGLAGGALALIPASLMEEQENGVSVNGEEQSEEGDYGGRAENRLWKKLGAACGASAAGGHSPGRDGGVYRGQRFAAGAADARGRAGDVCAASGRAQYGEARAHRAQPAAGGVHRQKV